MRDIIKQADELIAKGFDDMLAEGPILVEIAQKNFPPTKLEGTMLASVGGWLDFAWITDDKVTVIATMAAIKPELRVPLQNIDYLAPALAAVGGPGSAARIAALADAYHWRESLGDDSSPFGGDDDSA